MRISPDNGGPRDDISLGHVVEHLVGKESVAAFGIGVNERGGNVEIGSVAQDEDVLVEGEGVGEGRAGLEERGEGVGVWNGAISEDGCVGEEDVESGGSVAV